MLQPWTCHCGQHNLGSTPCSACLNAAPPSIAGAMPTLEPWRAGALFKATAVLSALLLVVGLVAAAVMSGDDDPDPPAIAARAVEVGPDSVPAPGASELEQILPSLLRFTSKARGLRFLRPVRVTLLDDEAFRARLRADADEHAAEDAEELRTTQRVLEGLGLLEDDIDLEAVVESLLGDAVLGVYDSKKGDLVVRGDALTVSVRVTLVHELTHALQDQHFDIVGEGLEDRDDESAFGLDGVVEGDAVRVERLYLATLSSREQKRYEIEQMEIAAGIDPDVPRVLYQYLSFPYLVGPDFTTVVHEEGGQERLDGAFREPPISSEQLLHPEAFLAGEPMIPVEVPDADGEVFDEGILGEFDVLIILTTAGIPGTTAAEGWGGSRYVAWEDGDDTCVRATIATDSPQDDAELRQALDRLARSRDGVKVIGRGPLTMTSCG